MDDRRIGMLIRAARIRRGWRQMDVELAAGVDQTTQSLIERGRLDCFTLQVIRRAASAVGADLELQPRGGSVHLLRLVDEGHARLVERLVSMLRLSGWTVLTEYTFNHYGERGSVDIVAWHSGARALLIVEVKTRITDVQELFSTFDRKCRIVPRLLQKERGWAPVALGRLVVIEDGSTQRRAVRSHAATFAATLPLGSREARRWVRHPSGSLAARWFLSSTNPIRGKRHPAAFRRVRAHRSRSAMHDPLSGEAANSR